MDAFCRLTERLCWFMWSWPFRGHRGEHGRGGEYNYARVPSAFVRYVVFDEMAQKAFEQRRAGKDESAFYMSPPQEILRELARRPIPVPQDTESWDEIEHILAAWLVELEDHIFKNRIITVADEDEELDAEDDDLNPATTWKWRIDTAGLAPNSRSLLTPHARPRYEEDDQPRQGSQLDFNRPSYWFTASRGRHRIHFILLQFPDSGTEHIDL